jgi:cytochrome P450
MDATTSCPHAVKASTSLLDFEDMDPFPAYEALRTTAPVLWDEGLKGWVLLSDELCRFVETREDLFRTTYADATPETKAVKGGEPISVLIGEKHDRSRRFHMKLLSPPAVEAARQDHVRPVIDWLVDRFIASGKADLAQDLAYQLPTRMILSMFDMDWRDDALVDRIHGYHNTIVDWIGRRNPGGEYGARGLAASEALNDLLLPVIASRQTAESTDLISQIWRQAPAEYGPIDERDVLAICRELLFAGGDTTMQSLANAAFLLLTTPVARAAVDADRKTALNNFVEEALRLYPSAQWRFRIANQDIELGGVSISKDQVVISVKAAANRDPERYECPAEVRLDRNRPSDHLTFNTGPRLCAGARLARAEMREMVGVLLDRLPNLRLDPDAAPPRLSGLYMQGFRPLNVLFDAS